LVDRTAEEEGRRVIPDQPESESDQVTVAFVASALPARFIRAQAEALNISRIVCASRELEEVFRYAAPPDLSIEFTSIPSSGGALAALWFLIREVRKAEGIVVFHECCWVALDVVILLIHPKLSFFPQVSLAGFSKLPVSRLPNPRWLFKHFGVIQGLLLILWRDHFDFYDMASDGGCGREAVAALQYSELQNAEIHTCEESLRLIPVAVPSPNPAGLIALIICAREPVLDSAQRSLYREVCDRLVEAGYSIYIKDHPRNATRLNFSYPGAQIIPPHVPADLCDIGPRFAIGICSSALAAYGSRALSLVRLLAMSEADVQSRIAHLPSLPGGTEVSFVRNWSEFAERIKP
jgi:hypothetical protein